MMIFDNCLPGKFLVGHQNKYSRNIKRKFAKKHSIFYANKIFMEITDERTPNDFLLIFDSIVIKLKRWIFPLKESERFLNYHLWPVVSTFSIKFNMGIP